MTEQHAKPKKLSRRALVKALRNVPHALAVTMATVADLATRVRALEEVGRYRAENGTELEGDLDTGKGAPCE